MENKLITTDYRFSLSATTICLTEVKEWTGSSPSKTRLVQNQNLINNKTKGLLSAKSIKRLKNGINWLVISSEHKEAKSFKTKGKFKFKINFITLTIPPQRKEQVNEKQFKQLLNTWLTYHRKYNKLNNYIWKIETHKDGRFHIHITTDTYIHMQSVKDSWNTILKRNGLLENHFKRYNNYSPPSTEVKSVKKIKKIGAYLAKYMTKNNQENPMFNGRVWGCSMKISKVLGNVCYVSPDKIYKVTKKLLQSDIKAIEVNTNPNVFGRYYKIADVYLMAVRDWIKLEGSFLYEVFKELVLFLRVATSRDSQLVMEFVI